MVSGHTAQESGKVLSLCGGSYIGIDVGITAYYGNFLFYALLHLRVLVFLILFMSVANIGSFFSFSTMSSL